jgi:hypothetical protein
MMAAMRLMSDAMSFLLSSKRAATIGADIQSANRRALISPAGPQESVR